MSGVQNLLRRQNRVRHKVHKHANGKPRLSVYRSNKYIYAQIIDDAQGKTVASASSLEKDLRDQLKSTSDMNAADAIGKLIATRAVKAGVKKIVFDRGAYLYHGRIKALADAARAGGLEF